MAEKRSLIPPMTTNNGPGVTLDALQDSKSVYSAFDGNTNTTWQWKEGYYDNVVYINFDKPIKLEEFTVKISSYGYTNITGIFVEVGNASEQINQTLSWTSPTTKTFKLSKPFIGKKVKLTIMNNTTQYKGVDEITLFGSSAELFLIEIDRKMYTVVNGNMTRISDDTEYTTDTFMKYGIDKDEVTKNINLIKGTGDRFKLHTLA